MPKIKQREVWGDEDAGHCPAEARGDGDGELLPFRGTRHRDRQSLPWRLSCAGAALHNPSAW